MRQVPNGKRSRNRPGRGNRPQHSRNQSFDSSGPEGKVRGNANQVYEKYLAMARDAQLSGNRVAAENYFQHAEHYFRIMAASGQPARPRQNGEGAADSAASEGATVSRPGAPQPPAQPQANLQPQPQPEAQPQPRSESKIEIKSEEASTPSPSSEGRPETPAELAASAAANGESPPARGRGRRPRRNPDKTPAEA